MKVKLEDVCERGTSNLKQSDILGKTGDYPIYGASGYIGNVDFYHQEYPYVAVVKDGAGIGRTTLHPAKSSVIGTMQYLLPKDNVLPEYLYYVVKHMKLEKYFTGATIPHIYFKDYKNEEFNLDTLERQSEIVTILGKLESVLLARQRELQKLDELVKARFVEMFGDEDYPHTQLINLIIDGAGLSYGIVQPGENGTGDMGVLRPVDIVDGSISTASIKYIDRTIGDGFKKTELNGDELLITVRGTTGVTALTDSRFVGMNVTRGIAVIRYDHSKINPVYLNAYLNTDESQRYIKEHTRGATLQQINLSDLRVQEILVPPYHLQDQFAAFVSQVDKSKFVVAEGAGRNTDAV
jgi:type I restriction enzyme S subunit